MANRGNNRRQNRRQARRRNSATPSTSGNQSAPAHSLPAGGSSWQQLYHGIQWGNWGKYAVISTLIGTTLGWLNDILDLFNNINTIPRWIAIGISILTLFLCFLLCFFFKLNKRVALIVFLTITCGVWTSRGLGTLSKEGAEACKQSLWAKLTQYFSPLPVRKFTIAVSPFKGQGIGENIDSESLSDHYITKIEGLQANLPEISITRPKDVITQNNGGSSKAHELGKCVDADIVVWGFYNSSFEVTAFVEIIKKPKDSRSLNLNKRAKDGEVFRYTSSAAQKQSLKIEDAFSGDANRLLLLLIGLTQYQMGDYDKAIQVFSRAEKQQATKQSEPYLSEILLLRGNCFVEKMKLDAAIADYLQSIYYKPDLAESYANLASIYLLTARYDQASLNVDCAISFRKNISAPYVTRATLFAMNGDYAKAIADCNTAIRLITDKLEQAPVYNTLGNIYWQKGDFNNAMISFSRSLDLGFSNPAFAAFIHHALGRINEKTGSYDIAMREYDWAITLLEDFGPFYLDRGNVHKSRGDYDKSIADYNSAINLIDNYKQHAGVIVSRIDLQADYAMAYSNRGLAYLKKKDADQAKSDWDRAIAIDNNCEEAHFNRAMWYKNKKEYGKAFTDYNRAIDLKPNDAQNYFERGHLCFLTMSYDKAIEDFTRAVGFKDGYSEAFLFRARSYHDLKNYEKAMEDYGHAISINDNLPIAYLGRGKIYHYQRQDYEKALLDYSRAIKLEDDSAEAYFNRGCLYHAMGKSDLAISDWNQAIRIQDDYVEAYMMRGGTLLLRGEIDKGIDDVQKAYRLTDNPEFRQQAGAVLRRWKKALR